MSEFYAIIKDLHRYFDILNILESQNPAFGNTEGLSFLDSGFSMKSKALNCHILHHDFHTIFNLSNTSKEYESEITIAKGYTDNTIWTSLYNYQK